MKYRFPMMITGVPTLVIKVLRKMGVKLYKCPPPSLIHNEIVKVQPMKRPVGEAFFMKVLYKEGVKNDIS